MLVRLSLQKLQWFLCFSGFLDLFGVSMLLPLLIHQAHSLGASPSQVGLFGSIYGLAQFFASPFNGQVSDHIGRKKVLLVSLIGTSVSYFLIGQATTISSLCLARIPSGIFKFSQSMSRTFLADITGKKSASMLGRFNSMSSAGFIAGPAIGGILASYDNGFEMVTIISTVIFLLNAFLVYCFVPYTTTVSVAKKDCIEAKKNDLFCLNIFSPSAIFKDLSVIPWTRIWRPFLMKFLFALAVLIFRSNFTSILTFRFNVDTQTNGFIMSFNGIVSAVGSALVHWMSKWFKTNENLHNTFSVIFVVSLLAVTLAPTLSFSLISIVPFCLASSVLRVTNSIAIYEKGDDDTRGLLVGLSDTFTSLSRSIGPAVGGFAQEITLYGPGLCGTFFALLGTLVGFCGSKRIKIHGD